jgi:hypothetical protein
VGILCTDVQAIPVKSIISKAMKEISSTPNSKAANQFRKFERVGEQNTNEHVIHHNAFITRQAVRAADSAFYHDSLKQRYRNREFGDNIIDLRIDSIQSAQMLNSTIKPTDDNSTTDTTLKTNTHSVNNLSKPSENVSTIPNTSKQTDDSFFGYFPRRTSTYVLFLTSFMILCFFVTVIIKRTIRTTRKIKQDKDFFKCPVCSARVRVGMTYCFSCQTVFTEEQLKKTNR